MGIRPLLITWAGIPVGALVGGLIGYGVDLVLGQQGWWLALGGLGACLGTFVAAVKQYA